MTTTFETGATFVLKNDFSNTFDRFIREAGLAEDKIQGLIGKAGLLGGEFEAAARKAAGALAGLDGNIAATARKLGTSMDSAFAAWDAAAKLSTGNIVGTVGTMRTGVLDELNGLKLASDGAFGDWGKLAGAASASVIEAMRGMDASINATMGRMSALIAESRQLGGGMGGGSSYTPNANLRHAAEHGYGSKAKAILKGGTKGFEAGSMLLPFEVNPLTAGLVVGAAGVYEAIDQQHAAAKALMGGNLDARAYGLDVPKFVDIMKKGASETGDSFDAVAEAYANGSRILQGVDPATRLNLVQGLLKPAEYEAQLKGVSLGESVKAMLELAHQTGTYDVGAIQKMASQFSIASLNSNDGLDALTRQSAYFLPQLHAAIGMDFGSGVSLEVAAQNAGLQRAGTSVKNFFENAFSKTGKGADAHNDALRALGLIGADDKPLWQILGADGKTDWTKSELHLGEMIEKKIAGMDDTGRSDTLHHAFGEQGGRLAALLSTKAFREQVEGIKGRVDQFGGDGDLLGQLKKVDPLQQWREAWTDLKNVLGDIGNVILPPLNLALWGMDKALKAVHATFDMFGGILAHGDPANKPMTFEEKNRILQGGLRKDMAWGGFDDGDDSPLADAVAGGFLKAFREIQSGGFPSSAAGNILNAAYTTYGDGVAAGGSLPSIRYGRPHSYGPGPSTAGAGRGGDDPALTARARESWDFWKSKGLGDGAVAGLLGMEQGENNFLANSGMFGGWGDKGAAYGAFMWHKDRRARIFAGTGINVIGASHQKQLEAAYWEMMHGEAGRDFLGRLSGMSPAAAAALGVNGFERPLDRVGASRLRGGYAEHWYGKFHGVSGPPPRRVSPGSPAGQDGQKIEVVLHNHTHLNGRKIQHEMTRQIVATNAHPRSVGGPDWHNTYQHPGSDGTDVA